VQRAGGCGGLALTALAVCASSAAAQTIQFPRAAAPSTPIVSVPATGNVITAPSAAPTSPYGGGTLGPAPFDPYSASGSAAYNFWQTTPPVNTTGVIGAAPLTPYGATTPFPGSPLVTTPPGGSFPTYGPPPPTAGAPSPYVFPNGLGEQWDLSQSIRFIQDVRLRHTYLHGGNDVNDLGINDTEVAVTFTVPNFFTTGQPLFISPAFALHLWDGPISPPSDLPPSAYSAYLDFQWASDPKLQIGAELGVRVGAYSDFNTLSDESLRIQGLGLGVFRLTPALTFKIGAMYLDRNKIKILPAGGLLWTPTPQVRFDIFFPQPKLSAYLTTVGKYELWWYLAGEYGGGAWTIERAASAGGGSDAIDINDIRASAGLEWNGPRGLTGFFEAGFVFRREVVYVVDPSDTFDPGDTFMLRAGVSF
jgi:hypothetical protein